MKFKILTKSIGKLIQFAKIFLKFGSLSQIQLIKTLFFRGIASWSCMIMNYFCPSCRTYWRDMKYQGSEPLNIGGKGDFSGC